MKYCLSGIFILCIFRYTWTIQPIPAIPGIKYGGYVKQGPSFVLYYVNLTNCFKECILRVNLLNKNPQKQYPILVVVKQDTEVLSYTVPVVINNLIAYNNVSRNLCPISMDSAAVPPVVYVELSTASPIRTNYELIVESVERFDLPVNTQATLTVLPAQPVFFRHLFSADVDSVAVRVTSSNTVCMTMSLQNLKCPIYDYSESLKTSGLHQTVTNLGTISTDAFLYSEGFYIVLVLEPTDYVCSGIEKLIPSSQRHRFHSTNMRSKDVVLSVVSTPNRRYYIFPVFGAIAFFGIFYLLATVSICACNHWRRSTLNRSGSMDHIIENTNDPLTPTTDEVPTTTECDHQFASSSAVPSVSTPFTDTPRHFSPLYQPIDQHDCTHCTDPPHLPTPKFCPPGHPHSTSPVPDVSSQAHPSGVNRRQHGWFDSFSDDDNNNNNDDGNDHDGQRQPHKGATFTHTPQDKVDVYSHECTPVPCSPLPQQIAHPVGYLQPNYPIQRTVDTFPPYAPVSASAISAEGDTAASSECQRAQFSQQYTGSSRTSMMYVADLSRKHYRTLNRKYLLYFWYLIIITIFYGLPAVQLIMIYQKAVFETGNEDLCYYNFDCARPFGIFSAFNNIISNIGYLMLGILFLLLTARRDMIYRKLKVANPEFAKSFGLPQHYGLYYSMGFALTMEGVMSACYHMCPSFSNFQFDTAYMYILAILIMLKIYQARHSDVNASAHSAYMVIAVVIFLAVIGVFYGSDTFWIAFTIGFLLMSIVLNVEVYYVGQWNIDMCLPRRLYNLIRTNGIRCLRPVYLERMLLLLVANAVNFALAVCGVVYRPRDFAFFLLAVLMINTLMYTVSYILMKLRHRERILPVPIIFMVFACISWAVAIFFFSHRVTSWEGSPAQSRALNQRCILLDFYDVHDVWHFMSAISLFFSFMMLMTLDDGLRDRRRNQIPVF